MKHGQLQLIAQLENRWTFLELNTLFLLSSSKKKEKKYHDDKQMHLPNLNERFIILILYRKQSSKIQISRHNSMHLKFFSMVLGRRPSSIDEYWVCF